MKGEPMTTSTKTKNVTSETAESQARTPTPGEETLARTRADLATARARFPGARGSAIDAALKARDLEYLRKLGILAADDADLLRSRATLPEACAELRDVRTAILTAEQRVADAEGWVESERAERRNLERDAWAAATLPDEWAALQAAEEAYAHATTVDGKAGTYVLQGTYVDLHEKIAGHRTTIEKAWAEHHAGATPADPFRPREGGRW